MGSYKRGSKSPNVNYKYSYLYLLTTPRRSTHELPSCPKSYTFRVQVEVGAFLVFWEASISEDSEGLFQPGQLALSRS